MKHLFSPEGDAALASTMARRPLLAFDFDGTLAPIVSRPDEARVPHGVARRLDGLGRILPLAIISGRAVADLRQRLDFEPRYIIGNHGAEDPSIAAPAEMDRVFDGIRERLRAHAQELGAAGVTVEDKRHSIALHYRLAPDCARALGLITRLVSGLGPGVGVFGGKMVVNVTAVAAPDKAQALAILVARSGVHGAVFVGDDINDEPVFARAAPTWLTLRVGGDAPNSRARFYLEDLGDVERMLDRMLALLV